MLTYLQSCSSALYLHIQLDPLLDMEPPNCGWPFQWFPWDPYPFSRPPVGWSPQCTGDGLFLFPWVESTGNRSPTGTQSPLGFGGPQPVLCWNFGPFWWIQSTRLNSPWSTFCILYSPRWSSGGGFSGTGWPLHPLVCAYIPPQPPLRGDRSWFLLNVGPGGSPLWHAEMPIVMWTLEGLVPLRKLPQNQVLPPQRPSL